MTDCAWVIATVQVAAVPEQAPLQPEKVEPLAGAAVSVTDVRLSPDLRHATVYVTPLLGADEEIVLKALRTNTAYFQREVAGRLKLKYAAKIRFLADESFDEASRIDRLLADPRVQRDLDAEG